MTPPLLAAVLNEPAVADPPARSRRDWVLAFVVAGLVVLEAFVGVDQPWGPAVVIVGLGFAASTLWRRRYPLAMTAATFGSIMVIDQAQRIVEGVPVEFYSFALVLIHPYALFRWASGRNCLIGVGVLVGAVTVGLATDWTGLGDAIGGIIFLSIPAVVGLEVRHLIGSRDRRIEQAREHERTLLARELHDTVAHHVSAIAVRAQAGQVVGASDPVAALDALQVIEKEASRTLAEMRGIVGALRGHEGAEFAPQPDLDDIERLADPAASPPVRVSVERNGVDVGPAVATALFRIAQEGVTNARRHARRATGVDIRLDIDADRAALEVHDDGQTADPTPSGDDGFGLVGMRERVELLGGRMHAGPKRPRGWRIAASIPLRGAG